MQNASRNQSLHVYNWNLLALLLFCSLIIACQTSKLTVLQQIDKTSSGKNGMVVSAHPLASTIGLDILKAGGNAIDAAVAVQFALAVVYPNAGNIGGGGFLILRTADGSMLSLDYRETAPSAANSQTFLDEKGDVVADKSFAGHNSVAVPGTVAGMWELHQKYGKLPWKKLVQASIDLAKKGFSINAREAKLLNDNRADFKQYNTQDNAYENTKAWNEGDLLVLRDLAATLERIRDAGKDGFYKGFTAEAIVAEMNRGKGIMTLQDLRDYEPKWRAPVIGHFKEYTIITLAPPSSGGIILMQVLGMISGFNLDQLGMLELKSMTIMAEAEKIAFADRATHLGDPDFYHVPEDALLSPKYLKSRAALINPNLATPSDRISSGINAPKQSEQTTHYSIADKRGNIVSVTTSLNNNFGSKVVVGGAGFFLNSTMDDFSVKPGVPNMFGLTGSIANQVEPGKRMLSSMTPTIVLKNYQPFLALGSPGGPTICTTVFQVIANRIIFGKTLEQAVAAPRFHHQWKPDELYLEKDKFSPEVLEALKVVGYKLNARNAIGAVDAIEILPDGSFIGVADSRGNDSAAGY